MELAARIGTMARRGAPLPYDAEVEYLDSSDGAYLKIVGYTPSDNNIIHGHWEVIDVIKPPFGCLNFTVTSGYGRFFATKGLNWFNSGERNIVFDGVNKLVDGKKYPENIYTASASGDFWIFSRSDTGKVGGGRIYSWEEKTPDGMDVIDLIPVRVGDVGYMYDRVSGQLFGNAGKGVFVIGPDKTT